MQAVANSPIGRMEPIQSGVHAGTMAYVPMPLPKALPLSEEVIYVLGEADRAVGTLAGVGETLPNPQLLIAPFMRREAVLSSRIEGTMSSLSDLFTYEASNHPRGDVVEVHNYLAALEEGLRLMRERNLPISMRMMNALHEVLMSHGVRGHNFKPGEFGTNRCGSGRKGRASGRRASFRRRIICCATLSTTGSCSPTAPSCASRRSSSARCCITSSRRSTRTTTATGASGVC